MTKGKTPFENIMGKEENAGSQHFLHFLQCFLPYQRQIPSFKPQVIVCKVLKTDLSRIFFLGMVSDNSCDFSLQLCHLIQLLSLSLTCLFGFLFRCKHSMNLDMQSESQSACICQQNLMTI